MPDNPCQLSVATLASESPAPSVAQVVNPGGKAAAPESGNISPALAAYIEAWHADEFGQKHPIANKRNACIPRFLHDVHVFIFGTNFVLNSVSEFTG